MLPTFKRRQQRSLRPVLIGLLLLAVLVLWLRSGDPHTLPPAEVWKFWGQFVRPRSTQSYYGIDKVYVAHWSIDTPRRNRMEQRFETAFAGTNWKQTHFVSFLTELDAANITLADAVSLAGGPTTKRQEPESPVWRNDHKGIRKGALSLAAKHALAYYDALVHGYQTVLIMEDDADLVPNFGPQVEPILQALPSDWSNCFLANPHTDILPCTDVPATGSKICKQNRGDGSQGTVAYLMSLDGCRRMIQNLPIRRHSDWQMNLVSERDPNFVTYRTWTDLAFEDTVSVKGSWRTKEEEEEGGAQ